MCMNMQYSNTSMNSNFENIYILGFLKFEIKFEI